MVGYSSPKATTSARKNYEERNLKKFGKGNKVAKQMVDLNIADHIL